MPASFRYHGGVDPKSAARPLLDLVRAAASDRSLWASAVRFDARARHWSRLLRTADVDLWLLTWLPGQDTQLHDHGDAAAAFAVVTGALEEVRAAGDGTLTRTRLGTGETTWVAPRVVHDVGHAGAGPAVSLHVYAPRLASMTFYELAPRGLRATRTVDTDAPDGDPA